jgi:hypothetical protein
MTREEWKQVLFEHVPDEVVQDMLNQYVLELESENAKLRELLAGDETRRRIAAIGEGTVPAYHGTETVDEARLVVENAKLRELALGLKWCGENYGCENLCPLYDKSEPEHCREERLLRELGIEVD